MKIKARKPGIRFLKEMGRVVFDKDFAKKFPNLELYYVYRGIKKKGELRYDITVIPPRMLGQEFVRTKGNRNSESLQELYTVLEGKTIFLMQKGQDDGIEDVAAVEAEMGDWIIIPPKYAVVMINPTKKTLKTGNWVSEKNKNIYEELNKMEGACYFYTKKGWVKNKNYKIIPKLRFEKPLKKMPENLDFLKAGMAEQKTR